MNFSCFLNIFLFCYFLRILTLSFTALWATLFCVIMLRRRLPKLSMFRANYANFCLIINKFDF